MRVLVTVTVSVLIAAWPPTVSTRAAAPELVPGITREMVSVPFRATARTTYQLEAMLVRPSSGRQPLAILSHGSPRSGENRATFSPASQTAIAIEFARRGWAALVLMRRGYGASEGPWSEGYGSCDDPDYDSAGRASAQDIRAAIQFASDRGDARIDAARVLLVGVSAGGFASIASAAERLPGLVGVINFAGGRGSQTADDVCEESRLVSAYAGYGKTSTVPTLWIYAANDHFFGPALARRMFAAFQKSGGHGEFVASKPFGTDGHAQFSEAGMPNWRDDVDRFLRANRLPTWSAPVRETLATLPPPPGLSAKGREDFQKYLESTNFNKAFAVSTRGSGYAWRTGRRTADSAAEDAVDACETNNSACRVYATDNRLASRK